MAQQITAAYGTWKSPISPELVADSPHGWIGQLYADKNHLYVLRNHPEQGGRGVVARVTANSQFEELIPAPFYARTRVYEYGGACFVVQDDTIYFSNVPDDRLYRQMPGQQPEPITAEGAVRYADLVVDPLRSRLICIREDRREDGEPKHTLTAINMAGDEYGTVLFDQADFVAFPALSPDGHKLAWVSWNHPNMPFYSSSLWAAEIADDGSLIQVQQVVPEQEESITDPCWSPDGVLYFCSDRSNWWNLYRWQNGNIEDVCPMEAELGNPFWNIGLRMYRFLNPKQVFAAYNQMGSWRLGIIDLETGRCKEIPNDFTFIIRLEIVGDIAYIVAASPIRPRSLIKLDLKTHQIEVMDSSVKYAIPDDYLSPGEHISYPTERGLRAYGYYHPPKNPEHRAPENELPPLIVNVHGGPTGSTKNALDMAVQFFTSRGFAVLDINYGGSAGYGREYRSRLRGQWGVVDVEDAVNGARHLIRAGLVDAERTIICGGSAGGFTTFAALAFTEDFKAGCSLFGISDLEVFHKETHKYESRYCETLVGPYPEARALYRERSAMSKADRINSPLLIFQGSEDRIVPPNQSQFVADALTRNKVPVAYIEFEGEGHGFRKRESVLCVINSELAFFGRIFGFRPADVLPELEIKNFAG